MKINKVDFELLVYEVGHERMHLDVSDSDRDNDALSFLTAYVSNPDEVGELAEMLLETVPGLEGDVKADHFMITLHGRIFSEGESAQR